MADEYAKLHSCPLCEDEATIIEYDIDSRGLGWNPYSYVKVGCEKCELFIDVPYNKKQSAIDRWNRRQESGIMTTKLVCPKCGGKRFMEYCLTSNPPQYEVDCCNGCGVVVRWFQRADPFVHVTQAEVDASALSPTNKVMPFAKPNGTRLSDVGCNKLRS